MTESLSRHSSYDRLIESGAEWLGDIPLSWNVHRMRFLFREISVKNRPNETLLSVTQNQGVVPRTSVDNRMVMPSGNLETFKLIEKGNFAISLRSFEGGLEYCYHTGIISPAYTVLTSSRNDLCPEYYRYLFKSSAFVSELQTSVVGIREGKNISFEELKNSLIPLPSHSEQVAIARFLDKKTQKIDQATGVKEEQVNLLKERKKILIQNAVTRGLNPDAPMRDSGVEWIGEVPKHWEVKKLRFLGTTQNGVSAGADYFGSGFPFVTYGDVYRNRELPKNVGGLAKASESDRALYSVLAGDVFFTRTSETAAEIGFASVCFENIKNATFAGFLIRFRPATQELHCGYSKYYFNAPMLRSYFVKEMNLVTRASLSQELLKDLPVILPPLDEQAAIYETLERKSHQIEATIKVQQEQITKLKEYKATLINSAVTGKIKVPGVMEPDEDVASQGTQEVPAL